MPGPFLTTMSLHTLTDAGRIRVSLLTRLFDPAGPDGDALDGVRSTAPVSAAVRHAEVVNGHVFENEERHGRKSRKTG
jgi:hypothetical protein